MKVKKQFYIEKLSFIGYLLYFHNCLYYFICLEDCLDPTCGGHGSCVRGRCVCRAGWRGASCSERDARVQRCLPACSQRGVYDLDAGRCVCDPLYTGDDCSQGKLISYTYNNSL